MAALTAHDAHVPYRNSKLTQLMSDSLGGSAKTLMIVNVSPLASDVGETRSSLDYAMRVKQVKPICWLFDIADHTNNEACQHVQQQSIFPFIPLGAI